MIEVEEYVRINNDNRIICIGIGKVIKIVQETIYVDMRNSLPISFEISKIVKHSKNIIDLIEVGDYVNGYKVLDIMEDLNTGKLQLEMPSSYPKAGSCTLYENEIKSIVTKEQFKSIEYKVEEDK